MKKGFSSPIRKKCFLLLELMIALFLITCCLFPLFKEQVKMHRYEIQLAKQLPFEEQEALCNFKQKLFEHTISWKKLEEKYSIDKTERTALAQEGLLLNYPINKRSHYIFVERCQ